MWIIQIAFVILFLFAALEFGLIPPPNAKILLRINSGVVKVSKGNIDSQTKLFIADMLSDANVFEGFIAIKPNKRVVFSWDIPSEIKQKLRNVLLN